MRAQVGWKYFLIPVVYVGVILGLFYLQFSDRVGFERSDAQTVAQIPSQPEKKPVQKTAVKPVTEKPAAKKQAAAVEKTTVKPFTDSVSNFSLKGTSAQGSSDRSSGVTSLTVSGLGVTMAFDASAALVVTSQSGAESSLPITGYRKTQNGLELLFENDYALVLSFQNGGMKVAARMPKSGTGAASLAFPIEISGKTKTEYAEGLPAAKLSEGGSTYFLTAPMGSRFLPAEKRIVLVPAGDQGLTLEKPENAQQSVAAYWYSKNGTTVTEDDYRKSIDGFIRKAWAGWKTGRYNQAQGAWRTADGSFAWSEEAAVDYLAESVTRGDIGAAVTDMTAAAKLHQDSTGFMSNPFLGDLMKSTARQAAQDDQLAVKIRGLFSKKDPAVFADSRMLDYIALRAPASIRKEFAKYAGDVDIRNAPVASLLGMVYVSLEDGKYPDLKGIGRFDGILEDRIVPALYRTPDAMYLQDEQGKASGPLSLIAGRLLIDSGRKKGNAFHQSLGRQLVVSVLSQADKDGFIPASFVLGDKGAVRKDGLTAPENVYRWISDNRFLPKRIELPQIGPDAWIWTVADFTVEPVTGGFRLTFTWPAGQTHSAVIRGLKPYREIYLYRTKWRSTNLFQDYAYGLFYDQTAQTLYMKIKNKAATEELLVYYIDGGNPDPTHSQQPAGASETQAAAAGSE